jgi:hypothetical protein
VKVTSLGGPGDCASNEPGRARIAAVKTAPTIPIAIVVLMLFPTVIADSCQGARGQSSSLA